MQYRFITVYILLVIAIFTSNNIYSQGFVSESQLRHILAEENNESSFTGVWISEGVTFIHNTVKNQGNEMPSIYDIFTLIPQGDNYQIAANRETKNPKIGAILKNISGDKYYYESTANTGESISAECFYSIDDDGYERISYAYHMPPKLNYNLAANDSIKLSYGVYLYKIDLDSFYSSDEESQTETQEYFETEILNKELFEDDLAEIHKTTHSPSADTIRYLMDTGKIKQLLGGDTFPSTIKDDRFFVSSVNESYANRVTYTVIFENFDDHAWLFDFEVDDDYNMTDLICVDKSYKFSSDLIQLIKNNDKTNQLWR